jgi:hypothetical protein
MAQPQNDPLLIMQAEMAALRQQLTNQNLELQQHRAQIAAIPAPQAQVQPPPNQT